MTQEKINAKMDDILEASSAAELIKLRDFLQLTMQSYADMETIIKHVERATDKAIDEEAAYFLGKGGE